MKKIVTIILDGFGLSNKVEGNAIASANMECFNEIMENYPHSSLYASEEYVGLPEGQFGNSEVGHMTIGAGHKIIQSALDIDYNFENHNFEQNEEFINILNKIKASDKCVHVFGLLSDGGVHSEYRHFERMAELLKRQEINKVYFHLITDGRDTSVHSALGFINKFNDFITNLGVGKIATICGRYYAMDRDNNYDRIKMFYDAMTRGVGYHTSNFNNILNKCYEKNVTDEFIPAISLDRNATVESGDAIICLNFRSDRIKQILRVFSDDKFEGFIKKRLEDLSIISFFEIDKNIKTINLLNNKEVVDPLGIYLSKLGITQARIAETEKYAHVTYFFDGGYDGNILGCSKVLVPSPKVATYNLKPEMSAIEVTDKVVKAMEKDVEFVLVNFANPDMVGHTGDFDATVKALNTIDDCLKKIMDKASDNFYKVIILADHGNADIMKDENGNPITTHTLNKVPFIIIDNKVKLKASGDLTNVAPTILKYMDIAVPDSMKDTKTLFIEEE